MSLNIDTENIEPLVELPSDVNRNIEFSIITTYLFDKGVSSTSIDILSKEIDELVRIANWYARYDSPSEFETVAYLAIPLLRALGWTPQRMAIEWNNVDIALFDKLPRRDDGLSVVVEVKKKVDLVYVQYPKLSHMPRQERTAND